MKQNRQQVIAWIGMSEGGYVNHPKDPGGATNMGITQRVFDAWRTSRDQRRQDVRHITKAEADQIVAEQYLDPVRFDDLPSGLDYAVADFSVNSGPVRAAKELQRLLGVDQDGALGNISLAAIRAHPDIEALIVDYCHARMRFLRGLSIWSTFGKGWSARVMGRIDGHQDNDIGVIDRAVFMSRGQASAAPTAAGAAKAQERDVAERTWVERAMRDPAPLIPIAGGLVTPLVQSTPIQWALAAVIVLGAVYALTRAVKRGALL